MEKRTFLAIALSIAVWVGWFYFFAPDQETASKQPLKKITEKTVAQNQKKAADVRPVSSINIKSTGNVKEANLKIDTDKYSVELTNKGASLKKVKYKERDIDLVVTESPYSGDKNLDFPIHFSNNEFLYGNNLDKVNWNHRIEKDGSIRFYTVIKLNNIPVRIEKIYTFKKEAYDFNLEYRIANIGRKDLTLPDGTVIFSSPGMLGPTLDYSNRYNLVNGFASINQDFEMMSKGSGFFSKSGSIKTEPGSTDWIGIMSRYFLVVMLPQDFKGSGMILDNREDSGVRTGMYVPVNTISPRTEIKKSFRIYLGEKDKDKLRAVDPSIVDAADISKWIEPIRYFVVWCLLGINDLVGNLGWALVIFSLLTKLVFMPLTNKSTDSMKKMQELTPKVNELKAKYKDKPDVLQRETMKLYKENKVNPLGGCLPLLLQMPFFFALYSALINSIDLWNAPFILWMQDLSMPDTVATISGFNLNILPILMTITTFLQQKLTSVDAGSQQQKIMMTLMPVFLIFIFWTMPSGLVLYWTLQNAFQVLNQIYVNKWGKAKEK